MSNTALAAQYVAECQDSSKAAIASRAAGKRYGLEVLAYPISCLLYTSKVNLLAVTLHGGKNLLFT